MTRLRRIVWVCRAGLLLACMYPSVAITAGGDAQTPVGRSENQLPYYIPGALKYSTQELAALRKAATDRNVAVLGDQAQAALDRSAYLRERQAIAGIDLERRRWLLGLEQKAHDRQLLYSDIVFWVANVIVAIGIWLTIRQFTRDEVGWKALFRHNLRVLRAQLGKHPPTPQALAPIQDSETKITLKSDGIEIGTRVTGLAILVISLGFYYLMLVHVYRINAPSDGVPTPAAASAGSAPK